MTGFRWHEGDDILVLSSARSIQNSFDELTNSLRRWVVLVRIDASQHPPRTLYYVFRRDEVVAALKASVLRGVTLDKSTQVGLNLREKDSSHVAGDKSRADTLAISLRGRPDEAPINRAVRTDGVDVIAVGFPQIETATGTSDAVADATTVGETSPVELELPEGTVIFHIGPVRSSAPASEEKSGGGLIIDLGASPSAELEESKWVAWEKIASPDTAGDLISVVVSAETKRELEVGKSEPLEYRIEILGEANPLALSFDTKAHTAEQIRVVTSVDRDAVEIFGQPFHLVDAPTRGKPTTGAFMIQAQRVGRARIAVSFRQGGTQLGAITLSVEIVEERPALTTAGGVALAQNREVADDDSLELLIETKPATDSMGQDSVCYEYKLNSLKLGFNYLTVRSRPLLNSGNSLAKSTMDYVERIYKKVTPPLQSMQQAKALMTTLKALGASLCEELFDPEVTRVLWPLRRKIRVIKLTTWESYIPWELIRLANPDTKVIDDRFLCEYGLIRTESGKMPPTQLRLNRWAYLAARYPNNTHPSVGSEVEYFTRDLPAKGIQPIEVLPEEDALFGALNRADFDVFHISCHGNSPTDKIDDARLVIGDRLGSGGAVEVIEIFPAQINAEAKYSQGFADRQPLVFLNGCETARFGALLTSWGGWPNVFLGAGAGVFVGTSWSVREKPAVAFATTFYEALRQGKTLIQAAAFARAEAKKLPDASWLAFKVYGHPRARAV